MSWLDARGQSYLAWTWDTWGCGGPVLISNFNGTPCQTFGQGYKDHLAALTINPTPTPAGTAPTPLPASPTLTRTPMRTPTPPGNGTTTIDDSVTGSGTNQFNYVGANWLHC